MPAKQVTRYDAEEFLKNNTGVVAYLNAALEDGDPQLGLRCPKRYRTGSEHGTAATSSTQSPLFPDAALAQTPVSNVDPS